MSEVLIMADNTLAIRFSDENYSTRTEVSKALDTSLIDKIWEDILLYRKQFRKQINLVDITKVPYTITYLPSLIEKIEKVEEQISEYIVAFGGLDEGKVGRYTIFREMSINQLRIIAKLKRININDVALNNIIEYKNTDSMYEPLHRYFSAVTHLDKNPHEKFNLNTIANYYSIISGEDYSDDFFRKSEINAQSQRLLINREYEGAPTQEIPFLMNKLIAYINESKDSVITKVAVLIYTINYVKPFEKKYNGEMAAILAKLVVALNDVESAAAYIPLESLILDEKGILAGVSREIQRSRDLTYEVTRVIDLFSSSLDVVADRIAQITVNQANNSFTFGESREDFEKEFGFTPSEDIIPSKPVVEEPKAQEYAIPQPKVEEVKKPREYKPIVPIKREPEEENALSDKQLRRMAQNLLEEDPFLKKGQAHFYVRHCTKGKYYTIQQYKKSEGCVYETARTSMDNLARLGYYRREQVKNKFVYTPIDKE